MTHELDQLLERRFSAQREALTQTLHVRADWADIAARTTSRPAGRRRKGRLDVGGFRGALLLAAAFLVPASAGAAVGLSLYPHGRARLVVRPIPSKKRIVARVMTKDGPVALWEGPARDHRGWCFGVIDDNPEDRGAACGWHQSSTLYTLSGKPPFSGSLGSLQDGRPWHHIWSQAGYVGPRVRTVLVRYQDGSTEKAAIGHGWYIAIIDEEHFQAGRRPTELLAYDGKGEVIATQTLSPTDFIARNEHGRRPPRRS